MKYGSKVKSNSSNFGLKPDRPAGGGFKIHGMAVANTENYQNTNAKYNAGSKKK